MQIASTGGQDYSSLLKQLAAALQSTSADFAGQESTTATSVSAATAGSLTATTPPRAANSGSDLFGSDTLLELITVQNAASAPTSGPASNATVTAGTASSASASVASDLTSALNQVFSDLEKLVGGDATAQASSGSAAATHAHHHHHHAAYAAAEQQAADPGSATPSGATGATSAAAGAAVNLAA